MSAHILVVDDERQFERLILQRFRRKVRAGEYNFAFAENGRVAVDKLRAEGPFDMVLTDINMPVMDGLTLVAKIKEEWPLLKTVMVSAYGDMKNIRTAMNRGAFDFVVKPIEFADLEATIQKTLAEAEILKEVKRVRDLTTKNEQLEALDQLKTRFFTNISHEFRTPLTVINGMIEQIEQQPDRWLEKGVHMIRRNTNNLLDLVNQIMELRKLESGDQELKLVQADIMAYLRHVCEGFMPFAEIQDISLHFEAVEAPVTMDFDPEKILRMLSNLLDNAIKHTDAGGDIRLTARKNEAVLEISVQDTGRGIPAAKLDRVFDRFFMADTDDQEMYGTGIGLSLVKELMLLLGGKVEVASIEGEGTTFILHLPIRQTAEKVNLEEAAMATLALRNRTIPVEAQGPVNTDLELPKLLIVEDNKDIAQYLDACLEGHYQLDWAADGKAGTAKALEQVPDLIVSDVMMPKKDGFELCDILKKDPRTSHIPIVLLTAKADVESRIAGLERGADAYLAKPFERKELLVRLEKLLETRALLRQKYQSGEPMPDASPANDPEDAFVQELRNVVMENIDNEDFGVAELCRTMIMSRTQLHRKVKALTGRSTTSFTRYIRLTEARKILQQTDLNISQVAFEVGFKDPKYFSRTFTEEFGESPIQVRK